MIELAFHTNLYEFLQYFSNFDILTKDKFVKRWHF